MRLIFAASVLCLTSFGFQGGEGPCPVPDIPSHWIAEKTLHLGNFPVRGLQTLEEEKSLVLKTKEGYQVHAYDDSGVCLTSPSFAVFKAPLTYVPIRTMQAEALPQWLESGQDVVKDGLHYFRAVARHSLYDSQYKIVGITAETKGLKTFCTTPKLPNLRVSRGGVYPVAYFHTIDTNKISLYGMNLESCAFESQGTYAETRSIDANATLVRFGNGFLVKSSSLLLWREGKKAVDFKLEAKEILPLGNNDEALLVHTVVNTVELFVPSLGVTSRIMEDVLHFNEELVSTNEAGDRLFIATSSQLPESSGIYEFKLRSLAVARFENACPYLF